MCPGQGQVVLVVSHLSNVVAHQKKLDITPCQHCREREKEPLPVKHPLQHGLAATMPAQRVVLQRVEHRAMKRRQPKLQLFFTTRRFWPELYAKPVVRTNVRLQVKPCTSRTLRSIHPVRMKTLKKQQQKRKEQKTTKTKEDNRLLRHSATCIRI